MVLENGQIRREVVACLAAVHAGGDADSLSGFGPAAEEDALVKTIGEISDISDDERLNYIVERLKSLVAREKFVALGEIHPAWLVEALSKESPRIIGIVLRYLPSKQVRYIIEHLPKRIKHKLPQLIDAFAVPSQILDIIKERFERQFIPSRGPRDFDEFEFGHVAYLKSSDLEILFRDLGIHELAMALKGVDRRSLNILFNRLSIDEARALQQRIRSLVDVPPSILKDAKYTVLEMSLIETDSDNLLIDIGLNAFARSLTAGDVSIFPLVNQKMEPRLGYTLKRYIDEHINSNVDDICHKRQDLILGRVESLAKAGSIDENLVRYFVRRVKPEDEIMETPESQSSSTESDSWHTEDGVI